MAVVKFRMGDPLSAPKHGLWRCPALSSSLINQDIISCHAIWDRRLCFPAATAVPAAKHSSFVLLDSGVAETGITAKGVGMSRTRHCRMAAG